MSLSLHHQIHIDIPRMSPERLVLQPRVTEVRGRMGQKRQRRISLSLCQQHVTQASSAQCHVSVCLSLLSVLSGLMAGSSLRLELKVGTSASTVPPLISQLVCLVLDLFPISIQGKVCKQNVSFLSVFNPLKS